jgi:O-antigen/teichoic acid export membrane protein
MALGYGIPLALISGLAVRRSYATHRPALVSAVLATCALSLAFPFGFAKGSHTLTGLGRFEHAHHALDVVILAIPTLILLLSEVMSWRETADSEEPSLFSHMRNAPRRTIVGVVLAVAAVLWLAGASATAGTISLGVLIVGGALYVWWRDRTAVRRIRRDLR